MDKVEARTVLAAALEPLRQLTYDELVARMLDSIETIEVVGPSGASYQIELQGFWDDPRRPGEALRVLGAIDDGTLRAAFHPLDDGFLVAPDGSFLGE